MTDTLYIARTQELLGAIVKKPPLTEKLLSKPPFRFLHDVISAVIKNTGFAKTLYTDDEMKSDSANDKDSKVAYLQKIIDLVQLALNEPVLAKPSKIVAGQEPEQTNLFLQALARAVSQTKDSTDLVKRLANGERPAASSSEGSAGSNKENRGSSGDRDKPTNKKHRSTSKSRTAAAAAATTATAPTTTTTGTEKLPTEKSRKEKTQKTSSKEEPKSTKKKTAVAEAEKVAEKPAKTTGKKEEKKDKEKAVDGEVKPTKKSKASSAKDKTDDSGSKKKSSSKERRSEQATGEKPVQKPPIENGVVTNGYKNGGIHSPPVSTDPGLQTSPSRQARSAEQDRQAEELAAAATRQTQSAKPETTDARPSTAMGARPTTAMGARPTTARPGAPRVRRQELPPQPAAAVAKESVKPSVTLIAETQPTAANADNDMDNFVVEEDHIQPFSINGYASQDVEVDENDEHGGLVRKILETKKELEGNLKEMEETKPLVVYDTKERERITRETNALQESIQTLTQTSHPLGKIMDYLQEDVDTIVKELESWRQEHKQNELRMRQQRGSDNSNVDTLTSKLKELEQQIKDQVDAISTIKAGILENEAKIQRRLIAIAKK